MQHDCDVYGDSGSASDQVGMLPIHRASGGGGGLCDVLGNCPLPRGPGRDVTGDWPAPTGGWVRGQKWGGVDLQGEQAKPTSGARRRLTGVAHCGELRQAAGPARKAILSGSCGRRWKTLSQRLSLQIRGPQLLPSGAGGDCRLYSLPRWRGVNAPFVPITDRRGHCK